MSQTWNESPRTPLEIIEQEVAALRNCLEAKGIRVWRYVDSQKVLFNFWPLQEDEDPPFEDRFAFLRDPETLKEWTSTPAVALSDTTNEAGDYIHPLWHLVPEYHLLHKTTREDYIESILVIDPFRSEQSPDDLIGVVCIDAPYSNYIRLPETSEGEAPSRQKVETLLSRIREALWNYSNQLFRQEYPLDESDVGPRETHASPSVTSDSGRT